MGSLGCMRACLKKSKHQQRLRQNYAGPASTTSTQDCRNLRGVMATILLWTDPLNKGSRLQSCLAPHLPQGRFGDSAAGSEDSRADEIHSSGWGWIKPADVPDRGPVYDKRGKDDKLGVTCPGGGRWEVGPGRDRCRQGWDRSRNKQVFISGPKLPPGSSCCG